MYDVEQYLHSPLPNQGELLKIFKPEDSLIIFDIGACECLDSIKYTNLFPKSKVYAFEPLPKNIVEAKKNLKKYQQEDIQLFEIALSNQKEEATFFVSSGRPENIKNADNWDFGNKSSSLLPPDKTLEVHQWLKFDEAIKVQTDTLANFCKENQIQEIDFIHMDVQGAELMVLEGAKDFLQHIKAIWLEVESVSLYKNQPLKNEVEKFMQAHQFIKTLDTVDKIAGDQMYLNRLFFPKAKSFNFFRKLGYRIIKKIEKKLNILRGKQ